MGHLGCIAGRALILQPSGLDTKEEKTFYRGSLSKVKELRRQTLAAKGLERSQVRQLLREVELRPGVRTLCARYGAITGIKLRPHLFRHSFHPRSASAQGFAAVGAKIKRLATFLHFPKKPNSNYGDRLSNVGA
jgi:hypothetical protein